MKFENYSIVSISITQEIVLISSFNAKMKIGRTASNDLDFDICCQDYEQKISKR